MVKRLAWIGIWTLLMIGCTLVDNPDTPTPMPDPTEESETGIGIDESTPSVSESIDYPDGAKVGGVFRLVAGNGIVPDPAIGDDQTGDDLDSRWLVHEIYSGLTRTAPDQNHAVVPDLAQSFEVDTSGLRYEFMLRQDLKFSDGSPVTASDFKWSWERALSPRTGSPRAFDVLGSIEGAVEIAEGSADELSGVKAVDDRILQVTVSNPRSDFTALLADPVAFVLKRGNVENWGVDWGEVINEFERPIFSSAFDLPVGTGPFKLVRADYRKGPWVLERNEHYWDRQPYLDSIAIVTEYSTLGFEQWTAREESDFIEGDVDMIFGYPDGVELKTFPADVPPQTSFLVFNASQPPFDDLRFRKALALSIDHHVFDHFASSIYAAHGLLPPGFPGYSDGIVVPDADPEIAVRELDESHYDGEIIRFEPLWDGFLVEEFQAMIDSWSSTLGIDATYEPLSNAEYLRKKGNGTLQMIGFDVEATYPDPYAVFRVFSEVFQQGDVSEEWGQVSRMLSEAAAELDVARRFERYAELEQHLIDTSLVIPIRWYTGEKNYTFQAWVNDFSWPKYGGSKFKDVWFDETAPDR